MSKKYSQDSARFTSHQIVCIEGEKAFLYSEVIQVLVERQFCWARPLLLVKFSHTFTTLVSNLSASNQIIDLREGSDLLLPIDLFRPALDTEIIPLISQLNGLDSSIKDRQVASKHLNGFIQQVWQENFHGDGSSKSYGN